MNTKLEHARAIANYLPGGRLFRRAGDSSSNFHKLLRGSACEMLTAQGYLESFKQDIIPDLTVLYIGEWEKAVGIPDKCFPGTGSIDTRRKHVLVKLASLGVQTQADFVAVASIFGVTVQVISGVDDTFGGVFPFTFPFMLAGPVSVTTRFTIKIKITIVGVIETFPMSFPVEFGNSDLSIVECLYNNLKPANCLIIYEYI